MKVLCNEFRIISMKRTGHHSIQNWIFEGFEQPKLKVEHVDFRTGGKVTSKNKGASRESINKVISQYDNINLFICDFQQVDLDEANQLKNKNWADIWPATKQFKIERSLIIIIVRDPYNWAASTIKFFKRITPAAISIYKKHLKQCLGIHDYLENHPFIVINFNQWFLNQQYRTTIIKELKMNSSATQYQKVAPNGSGSSFDNVRFADRASQMNVLRRWETYRNNKVFQNIFRDKELLELSEKFGYLKPKGLIIP